MSDEATVQVPDYELFRRIGRGSYGEVWLAKSLTGQFRAVKIVHDDDEGRGAALAREFGGVKKYEPISRNHPNLVTVLHVGANEQKGFFFYVMELADDVGGRCEAIDPASYVPETLETRMRRLGRLPVADCVDIGVSLAASLEYLHSHDLVHRDVKLSSVLFVDGEPKLADIGLVSGSGARSIVGTEGYLPQDGPGTRAADLYALGKVLYEISTGKDRLAFPELPDDWDRMTEDPQLVQLNEIILHACDVRPSRRYASATLMREHLARIRAGPERSGAGFLGGGTWPLRRRSAHPPTASHRRMIRQDKAARRLPVYFLLDCSGSMGGGPAQMAQSLIRDVVGWLRTRHQPSSTPIVSTVIAFEQGGLQLSPVRPVDDMDVEALHLDQLECWGTAMLTGAMKCMASSISRELSRAGAQDGDVRPIAVWITDGCVCDKVEGLDPMDAFHVDVRTVAVMVSGANAEPMKQQLGAETLCLGPEQVDLLKQILDSEIRTLEKSPKAVFYPEGYDWERRLVP